MTLSNLAEMYREKGDYIQAEQLCRRSLEIWEKVALPANQHWAFTFNNLGTVYYLQGDYRQAEPLLRRALEMQEKNFGPDHPDVANSPSRLALLYQAQKDYPKAESFFQRTLTIGEKVMGTEHPNVAEALYRLAMLYLESGDTQKAIAFLTRSQEVREHNFTQTLVPGSERQKLLYLNLFSDQTNRALSIHAQFAPNDSRATNLALTTLLRRKGRGLDATTDTIGALRRRSSVADQVLLNRLSDLRSQLAALIFRGLSDADPVAHRSKIRQLEEQIDQLETNIATHSAEFRAQSQPVTLAAIQAAIPADAVLIDFGVYRPFNANYANYAKPGRTFGLPHYVAYMLRGHGEVEWVELGEAKAIDDAVDALRQALRDPQRRDVKTLARALDEKVMQPVRKLLGNTRQIFVSPDGALNLIPFAALVDEQQRYLVERYSIHYLTSGRDLLRLQTRGQSSQEPLVVAAPDFGNRSAATVPEAATTGRAFDFSQAYFTPLPGTAQEARALRALLPKATVLTREKATETALKQAQSPSLLHIATHGFFLEDVAASPVAESQRLLLQQVPAAGVKMENPLLRSGLGLAGANLRKSGEQDGILTALEVAGLNLWGTKLVALSACDTGVGQVKTGEGVYGLRRALVLAGAESQMMSLWSVSDQGTQELMVEYYKGLLAGQGRSAALRGVQLRMLSSQKRRHPFYWASFIVSGEWANLKGQR